MILNKYVYAELRVWAV